MWCLFAGLWKKCNKEEEMKKEIELRGVGGQGVILAAHILGEACLKEDIHVVIGEIHGMSQRGGDVICTVRMGDVYGALTSRADCLIALEAMEALRSYDKLDEESCVILNKRLIPTFAMSQGKEKIFSINEIIELLKKKTGHITVIDAAKLAEEAGSVLTENVIMLGALSSTDILPFGDETLKRAIEESVPKRFVDVNLKAFEMGRTKIK
jgi:indolepyruvate ferredoxin oxidoreductase beta subunit